MDTILTMLLELIRDPAIFIGLIAMAGLILQGQSASAVIKGTVKAIVGMLILLEGVSFIIRGIDPLAQAFTTLFAIEDVAYEGAALANFGDFIAEFGTEIGIVMLLGFVFNIVIARYTRFKSIYLTGNVLYWFAMIFVAMGVEAEINGLALIVFATIFQVAYVVISPAIARPLVKELTGNDGFTIGHTATIFCALGAFIGKFVGDPNKSTEDINVPPALDFFRETTVTSGLVVAAVYFIVGLVIGAEARADIFGEQILLSFAIIQGLTFAAAMVIILQGVRMMLNEIVPAFKGISDKLVPGAIPALDIPLIFPYGQNALLIGFVVSMISSIATLFFLSSSGYLAYAIIPLTIACYFDVAPGAIFANKRGGIKAAVLTSAIGGITLMLLVAFTIPMLASTVGNFLMLYGGNEFSLWAGIASLFAGLF
ncbi:PTS ascorbate transporter subunit IIC [Thaumasiovibrio subtropicus]|uniref:PTS ascorbate transporter subunit IIC n=1 Tax=Thaumasiovibrio subtropicus TaxID=1891207 RepID=UPI000B35D0DF|nr:PTS ascorbate transporter subunit IIC [Thaumasiovibrio subtropicus]